MHETSRHCRWVACLGAIVFGSGLLIARAHGQTIPFDPTETWRPPILPRDLGVPDARQSSPGPRQAAPIHLFRMPTGFVSNPVGIDEDELSPGNGPAPPDDDGPFQVTAGNYNPFFDFRWRGDPGGIGFFKLHSQYQLLQGQRTGVAVGLQAVTPAGREFDGLDDGPTILSPNVAWFQEIGNGTAIQGFVGTDMRARALRSDRPANALQYGLALQKPFPLADGVSGRQVHLFLQALGRYHPQDDLGTSRTRDLSLLPGIHWQMSESWWLSSGVNLPLGNSRPENMWQITCSWQF